MPTQPIPFQSSAKNADEGMHSNVGYELYNAIVDELGNLRKVPGYSEFADLGTGARLDGLWYNKENTYLIAVSGGNVYLIDSVGTVTDVTSDTAAIGTLCTFADFNDNVLIANGGKLLKVPVDTASTTSYIADANAPTSVTHVAELDGYALANNGTAGQIDFSNTDDIDTWDGEFFTFTTINGLKFMGVGDGDDRIVGFGRTSKESYRNDGSTPFTSEPSEFGQNGSLSTYSPVYIQGAWYFIDQYKQLVRMVGRQAQPLPTKNPRGLTAFLDDLYVDDAEAYWVYVNGYNWYVCNLPTEQVTVAYNVSTDEWSQWSYWDSIQAEHEQFRGRCAAYAPAWGKTLIGDSRSGKIYEMSEDIFTADGDIIRSSFKTGFLNRGSHKKTKRCHMITGRIKRVSKNNADGTLKMAVRYRNNETEGSWVHRDLPLHTVDGINYSYRLSNLGSYISRQWEFICSADHDFQMSPPDEDYSIGTR